MIDTLDKLIGIQEKKLKKYRESTFWSRNKKLIISIGLVLLVLWIFSVGYTYYRLPRIYTKLIAP